MVQVWPHQRWVEGKDYISQPDSNALPNAAQNIFNVFCGKGTLLTHIQLGVHQVLFCKAAFHLGGPQHILVCEVVLPQVQDFTLPLVEFHEVLVSLFLQPVKVPLDGTTTLRCISHSFQFCVIYKFAEGTLCPIIQNINEDVKQDQTPYWPLGYTTSYWPPTRPCATDHHPLGPAFQPVFNPPHRLLIQPTYQQFIYEDLMEDSVKGLPEVQTDNIYCSPLVYQASHFILEVY